MSNDAGRREKAVKEGLNGLTEGNEEETTGNGAEAYDLGIDEILAFLESFIKPDAETH